MLRTHKTLLWTFIVLLAIGGPLGATGTSTGPSPGTGVGGTVPPATDLAMGDGVGGIERTGTGSGGGATGTTTSTGHEDAPEWWVDMGHALSGSSATPSMQGAGTGAPLTIIHLTVTEALPAAPAFLFLGAQNHDIAFHGGVMVPSPDMILSYTVADSGVLEIALPVPANLPVGFTVYMQTWILDGGAASQFSASNALRLVTVAAPAAF